MNSAEISTKRPIGNVDQKHISSMTSFLNSLLANEYGLFTKTLNYHWNITGPRFLTIHSFLETQYKDLLVVMDDIAERVRVLDETPISTVSKMNDKNTLKEMNGEKLSTNQMLSDLFNSSLTIQEEIKFFLKENKEAMGEDPVTEDFLITLLANHEKTSWMYKSHLT